MHRSAQLASYRGIPGDERSGLVSETQVPEPAEEPEEEPTHEGPVGEPPDEPQ